MTEFSAEFSEARYQEDLAACRRLLEDLKLAQHLARVVNEAVKEWRIKARFAQRAYDLACDALKAELSKKRHTVTLGNGSTAAVLWPANHKAPWDHGMYTTSWEFEESRVEQVGWTATPPWRCRDDDGWEMYADSPRYGQVRVTSLVERPAHWWNEEIRKAARKVMRG